MISDNGASLSMKSSTFSEMSKTITMMISKDMDSKNVLRNFLIMYRSRIGIRSFLSHFIYAKVRHPVIRCVCFLSPSVHASCMNGLLLLKLYSRMRLRAAVYVKNNQKVCGFRRKIQKTIPRLWILLRMLWAAGSEFHPVPEHIQRISASMLRGHW